VLDVSFVELGVVLIVALLVVGPERLPKVAKNVGRWLGKGRRLWEKIKRDLETTLDDDPVEQPIPVKTKDDEPRE